MLIAKEEMRFQASPEGCSLLYSSKIGMYSIG